jgi:hypothetical protein
MWPRDKDRVALVLSLAVAAMIRAVARNMEAARVADALEQERYDLEFERIVYGAE